MRRRVLAIALAVAALAAAVILVLLADAVFATGEDLTEQSDRLAEPGAPPVVASPSGLRFRLARSMLGVDDDLEFVAALGRFDRARRANGSPDEQLEAHGEVEAELARIARAGDDLSRRARAANLNGVLLVGDAQLDRRSAARFLQLGLEAFRQAVVLDPSNDEAKYNLELLAGLLRAGEGSVGADSGSEGSAGAGANPGASGY